VPETCRKYLQWLIKNNTAKVAWFFIYYRSVYYLFMCMLHIIYQSFVYLYTYVLIFRIFVLVI